MRSFPVVREELNRVAMGDSFYSLEMKTIQEAAEHDDHVISRQLLRVDLNPFVNGSLLHQRPLVIVIGRPGLQVSHQDPRREPFALQQAPPPVRSTDFIPAHPIK